MRYSRYLLISGLALAVIAAPAAGQSIGAIWPPGGARGAKVNARIEGGGLAGASGVLVSGSGVKAQLGAVAADGNSIPVTLDIASDAGPGPYEVRVLTPRGVTSPGYVWVGALPGVEETEPNNQPEQSMKLEKLPTTVYGRSGGGEDVDWFQFRAEAGETLVMDIAAIRLYSALDPTLELRDDANHLLGSAMEGYDRDPRIIHTFKRAGTYRLQVRDTMYRGGGSYVYSLTIGKLPVITAITPPGGHRGETLTAQVEGANLGDTKSVQIPIPADVPENQTVYVFPQTSAGLALPIAVSADDNLQMLEPANPAAAPAFRLYDRPATISGFLRTPREIDSYPIHGEAGKPIQINILARSVGSRVLPFVRILDRAGKEVLNTEEQIGRDPQIVFSPPATGDYRLELTTVDARGGPDYYYRIVTRPMTAPDFRIAASPDAINVGRGQTVMVNVTVDRRGGFSAPVTVRAEGLPAGVTSAPVIIPSGQNSGTITLTAPSEGALAVAPIRIVGEAQEASGKLTQSAAPVGTHSRPGEGQPASRRVQFQVAASTADVPLYTLAIEPAMATLKPGESVMIKVKAGRKPGDNNANSAIALTLANLPPGVTAETPAVPEKAGEVNIKLTAAGDAKPITGTALLTGKLGENVQAAPTLTITVAPK